MEDKGYIVVGRGEAALERRLWRYIECRGALEPHVIVVKRRRYAMVRIDMLSAWRKLGREELAETIRLLCEYSAPGAEVVANGDLAQSDRVPIAVASELASRLAELGRRGGKARHRAEERGV